MKFGCHAAWLRAEIEKDVESVLELLRACPGVQQIAAAGEYRRLCPIIHEVILILVAAPSSVIRDALSAHPALNSLEATTDGGWRGHFSCGLPLELEIGSAMEFPFRLFDRTGSGEHVRGVAERTQRQGLRLTSTGFVRDGPEVSVPLVDSESKIYESVGLWPVEPELREDSATYPIAEIGAHPRLLEMKDLRGCFHNHTVETDGRSTLTELVQTARELGLEYLGIADHSVSAVRVNGLTIPRLQAQLRSIVERNSSCADFKIFAGVEADIKRDGTMDYPDSVLSELDYVVGSIHTDYDMSSREMTLRIIRALRNPYVTILGHLAGRLLMMNEGYTVDIPVILKVAAETNTIVELNANPQRLDLDWSWWPLAKKLGVRCAINPDAHHADQLRNLRHGVFAARKGSLSAADVINCRTVVDVEGELHLKRSKLREHS